MKKFRWGHKKFKRSIIEVSKPSEITTSDDWIRTATGVHFSASKPKPGDLRIEDIARALSNQCRFTGHCRHHYSVAQHLVYCARVVGRMMETLQLSGEDLTMIGGLRRYGQASGHQEEHSRRVMRTLLLHDASEAILTDVASPIKKLDQLSGYRELEKGVEEAAAKRFDLIYPFPPLVREIDYRMLFTEARDLGLHPEEWGWSREPYVWHVERWTPDEARDKFMDEYARCCQ
jgi:hypothetical protein